MDILLVCGYASALQGWGNMETTKKIKNALEVYGHKVYILYAKNNDELIYHLERNIYDLVWSSIYYFTSDFNCINNFAEQVCVSDILEERGIPFVGSNATVLKNMINKRETIDLLKKHGIQVHKQVVLHEKFQESDFDFSKPWFVKPSFEAESNGIDEKSIVHNLHELKDRVYFIWEKYKQPALVEEYLSGEEYTAAIIGNGSNAVVLSIENVIHPSAYKKYPVITQNLKMDNKLSFHIPYSEMKEIERLCFEAYDALQFRDCVRIDLRKDQKGQMRIMEVNGIPGLNPKKSRIFEIYNIYNKNFSKEWNYVRLVNEVVEAAINREVINESQKILLSNFNS